MTELKMVEGTDEVQVTLRMGEWNLIAQMVEYAVTDTNDGINKPITDELYDEDRTIMAAVRKLRAQLEEQD